MITGICSDCPALGHTQLPTQLVLRASFWGAIKRTEPDAAHCCISIEATVHAAVPVLS